MAVLSVSGNFYHLLRGQTLYIYISYIVLYITKIKQPQTHRKTEPFESNLPTQSPVTLIHMAFHTNKAIFSTKPQHKHQNREISLDLLLRVNPQITSKLLTILCRKKIQFRIMSCIYLSCLFCVLQSVCSVSFSP